MEEDRTPGPISRYRRKYRRLLLTRILSLEAPWFWNFRKYFSAQLYRQKMISYLLLKTFQSLQLISGGSCSSSLWGRSSQVELKKNSYSLPVHPDNPNTKLTLSILMCLLLHTPLRAC